ncbi:UDP-glycosyltransferase 91C1-like [Magnolia sinica]|uniref:UDP-glycosyltransferase 91C1-like n=1 Tax=Magnolia sinica TaxID=86752 RepID=UPI002659EDD9|nr:UDP-glycosyltransferase 91C1-like [Magnolia sinica]
MEVGKIHVLVFPWLAFGHMIPFVELSKHLAKRGHHVTFVSTPRNIERLPKFPHDLAPNINLVKLTLPHVDGLPENAEATMDIPPEKIQYLKKAMDGLEQPMSVLVEDIVPDWIIHDFCHHWIPVVASKFGIPCAYFSVFSATSHVIMGGPPSALLAKDAWTVPDQLTSPRPWVPFPTEVVYRHHEAVMLSYAGQPNVTGLSDPNRIGLTVQRCDMFSLRSCNEFEADWLSLLGELYQKPVIAMGTMPPLVPEISTDVEEHVVKMWLDKQANGSTVYIAFGSEVRLSKEQWHELALGLEISQLPFVWALRCAADEPELLPEGFEERTKDRGVVHKGWVPQLTILAHSSVGGFLTHGGWGSVNEGLAFGKPLIVFPVMVDQGLNARVVGEREIGAEVPRNEWDGSFDRDAVAKIMRLVMVDVEGEKFRGNAMAMKEIFGDHTLQDHYMDDFVGYLKDHKRQSGPLVPRVIESSPSLVSNPVTNHPLMSQLSDS